MNHKGLFIDDIVQITMASGDTALIDSPSTVSSWVKFDNGPTLHDVRRLLLMIEREANRYVWHKVIRKVS
jgi:hypothetical protein